MIERTRSQARLHDAAMRFFAETGSSSMNVTELAQAAGVARGTIYNNVANPDHLFEEVATTLAHEMYHRSAATMASFDDPARRLAHGVRMFVRRAHQEVYWGRFLLRFAMTDSNLKLLLHEPPAQDIRNGIASGRYQITVDQIPSVVSMIAGMVLSTMMAVMDGERGWRDAGSDMAELMLRAIGIPITEAQAIAREPLPELMDIGR